MAHSVLVAGATGMLGSKIAHALLEKNGVRRFVPSDFSMNYFKLAEGDNDNSDIRSQFAELLKASPVAHTFILNGAFTEVEVSPWGGLIDQENSTFSY